MHDNSNSSVVTLARFVGWLLLTAVGVTLVGLGFVIFSSLEDDICRPSETTRCVVVINGQARGETDESAGSQRFKNFLLALMPVGPGVVALVAAARMADRHLRSSFDDQEPEDLAPEPLLDAEPVDEARAVTAGRTESEEVAWAQLRARVDAIDREQVVRTAAGNPSDVAAQCALADLEVAAGRVEAGLGRLLAIVRATSGRDRDQARQHLLTLFTAVGATDPRVVRSRRALTAALY